MWAPDVHKVKPSSALLQLVAMFGAVGLFAAGVYEMRALAPMLPRAYPHDGLVKELSGQTDDASFAVSPCPLSLSLCLLCACGRLTSCALTLAQARTEAQNAVDDE